MIRDHHSPIRNAVIHAIAPNIHETFEFWSLMLLDLEYFTDSHISTGKTALFYQISFAFHEILNLIRHLIAQRERYYLNIQKLISCFMDTG